MRKTIQLTVAPFRTYGFDEWAEVDDRPVCDLCLGDKLPAYYDARVAGRWGYLCVTHFSTMGGALGLGFGQRLVLEGEYSVIDTP